MQCPCHDAKNDEVNANVKGNERKNEDVVRIKPDGTLYTGEGDEDFESARYAEVRRCEMVMRVVK